MRTRTSPSILARVGAAAILAGLGTIGGAGTALATPTTVGATMTSAAPDVVGEITVEPTEGLPHDGAVVTVTGTDFDPAAGIYVAVCVDNGPGTKPSPCIGGADTEGVGGATWISDNPPSYAEGLTLPYGPDGSFEVELPVPMVDEVTGVDCREVVCAVTVRYDHLRADDRGADHVVPVTFADEAGGTVDESEEPAVEETTEPEPAEVADPVDESPPAVDDATGDTAADDGASPAVPIAIGAAVVALGLALALVLHRRRARVG